MRPFDGLLFDLDGVIADSRYAITRAMNHALCAQGLAAQPESELQALIGPPLRHAFAEVLGRIGADPGLVDPCVTAYREHYETTCRVETLPYPGVDRLVETLAARLPLVVATSKPGHFAEPILEELGLRGSFRAVVGPGLAARAETKSETVGRALLELPGCERVAIVGDRHFDVRAGQEHGLATIGVTWGFGTREELAAAGADFVVDTPAELLAQLV